MIPASHTIYLIDILDDENLQNVLNNYDIYDEEYRNTLNNKIIEHYSYEEIGFETPKLFAHYLKVKLNEIMPKYNKLYSSELLKLDPLSNYSRKESLNKTNTGSSTSNSESTNTGSSSQNSNTNEKHVFQNTPTGELSRQSIEDYTYATTHNLDNENSSITNQKTNTTEVEDTTSMQSTENYIKLVTGNSNITTTELFTQFVNNFESIDKLIINELSTLFMGIY